MKARWLLVAVLCAAPACEDDPLAPPTGPTAAFQVTPGSGGNDGIWDTSWRRSRPPKRRKASPKAVIQALAMSYRWRDSQLFASILANDPARNAEFLFLLSEPTQQGETQWGYTEEARIHQRMFNPESTAPGDPPVPAELWPQDIAITLTPLEMFSERPDLYSENGGLDGKLDPTIWRAMDARYSTDVLFDLAGTDYRVEGEANFVVIEDRTKFVGDPGKFLLFIWEDLGTPSPADALTAGSENVTWGNVKQLFR